MHIHRTLLTMSLLAIFTSVFHIRFL